MASARARVTAERADSGSGPASLDGLDLAALDLPTRSDGTCWPPAPASVPLRALENAGAVSRRSAQATRRATKGRGRAQELLAPAVRRPRHRSFARSCARPGCVAARGDSMALQSRARPVCKVRNDGAGWSFAGALLQLLQVGASSREVAWLRRSRTPSDARDRGRSCVVTVRRRGGASAELEKRLQALPDVQSVAAEPNRPMGGVWARSSNDPVRSAGRGGDRRSGRPAQGGRSLLTELGV